MFMFLPTLLNHHHASVAITFFFGIPISMSLAKWLDALGPYLLVLSGVLYAYFRSKAAARSTGNSDGARRLTRSTDNSEEGIASQLHPTPPTDNTDEIASKTD